MALKNRYLADLAGTKKSTFKVGDALAVLSTRIVAAGLGLTGGGALTGDLTIALANTAVVAGTYGSATVIPELTVDAQGRLTSVVNRTITPAGIGAAAASHTHDWSAIVTGKPTTLAGYGITNAIAEGDSRLTDARTPTGTAGGDLAGSYPNPTLAASGVAAGTYGTASLVPRLVIDSKGRITGVTEVAVSASPSGAAGGHLSGTYPNPTIADGVVSNAKLVNASLTVTAGNGLSGGGLVALGASVSLAVVYGTLANTSCVGNDSRLSDARTPTGAAGGSLTGTYPNPTIASGAIVDAMVNASAAIAWSKISKIGAVPGDIGAAAASHTQAWSTITSTPTTLAGYGITDGVVNTRTIATRYSLQGGGTLAADRTLELVGDVASPGALQYYGTDAGSNRGWFALPSASGGAPTGASYVVIGADATLTAERVLAAGVGLSLTDGGANNNVTLAVLYGTSATTACVGNDARLSDSRAPTGPAGGDLLGTYPNPTIAGSAIVTRLNALATADLKSSAIRIVDGTDATKKLAFNISGFTSATTRTITVPDRDGNIVLDDAPYFDFDTAAATPAYAEGRVFWDMSDKTLSVMTEIDGVTLQVGQEHTIRVTNQTGSTLTNGSAVYVNGASGQRPTVADAVASSVTADSTIGLITFDILDTETGYVTVNGLVRGLDTSAWAAGTDLYLDATTPGVLTATAPTAPNRVIKVATVLHQHASSGVLLVDVRSDVLASSFFMSSPANNDGLRYVTANARWENTSQAAWKDTANTWSQAQRFDAGLSTNAGVQSPFGTTLPSIQALGTEVNGSSVMSARWGNNSSGPTYYFFKSRGAAIGDQAAVQQNDVCGIFRATASDGTSGAAVGTFSFACDGAVSTGIVPGRIYVSNADSAGVQRISLILESNRIAMFGELSSNTVSVAAFAGGTLRPSLQVAGTSIAGRSDFAQIRFDATAGDAPVHILAHSRGATHDTYTAVATGDTLGIWAAEGADGTDLARACSWRGLADGTVSNNVVPGRWEAWTANASGTETLALTINSSQQCVFAAGTAALPSIGVGSAVDGFYDGGTNIIGLALNGVDRHSFRADREIINHNAAAIGSPGSPLTGAGLQYFAPDTTSITWSLCGFGSAAYFRLRRANGTAAAPSALLAGDFAGGIFADGYGTTGFSASGSGIFFRANENWTDAAQGLRAEFRILITGGTTIGVPLTIYGDQIGVLDGTVSKPGNSWVSDPDTGDWRSAPNQISRSLGGVERFRYQSDRLTVNANAAVIGAGGLASLGSGIGVYGADGINPGVSIAAFAANPLNLFRRANGTGAVPTAVQSGDILGGFIWNGYGSTAWSGERARLAIYADENWTDAAQGTRLDIRLTSAGAASQSVVATVRTTGFDIVVPTTCTTLSASGIISHQGTFAGIFVHAGATAQSIPTGATYTKSTAFTTNDGSSNCTADAANDKITITRTGFYLVVGSFSYSGASPSVVWEFAVFLNGVEQTNVHCERKIGTGGDVGASSFSGIIDVTTAPLDIDVRLRHDQAGSENVTIKDGSFSVIYVGST